MTEDQTNAPKVGEVCNLAPPRATREAANTKWPRVRLEELCERIDYGVTASANFSTPGPRFLRITDIQENVVEWDRVPGCKADAGKLKGCRLLHHDIVFARTGATTGKSFLVENPPDAVFASYLIRLRPRDVVDAEYLATFLRSDDYWRQIRQDVRGGIQPGFNASMLAKLEIPLPPLPEQQRIAARLREQLAAVETARQAVAAQVAATLALPAALTREDTHDPATGLRPLGEVLDEVTAGIGEAWRGQPVLGATRAGLAPAREGVGKLAHRY